MITEGGHRSHSILCLCLSLSFSYPQPPSSLSLHYKATPCFTSTDGGFFCFFLKFGRGSLRQQLYCLWKEKVTQKKASVHLCFMSDWRVLQASQVKVLPHYIKSQRPCGRRSAELRHIAVDGRLQFIVWTVDFACKGVLFRQRMFCASGNRYCGRVFCFVFLVAAANVWMIASCR